MIVQYQFTSQHKAYEANTLSGNFVRLKWIEKKDTQDSPDFVPWVILTKQKYLINSKLNQRF